MIKWFLIIINIFSLSVWAQAPAPAQNAFQFEVKPTTNNTLIARWHIKPGHYLYQSSLRLQLLQPKEGQLGQVFWPKPGHYKTVNHQQRAVYKDDLQANVPLNLNSQHRYVKLLVHFQGCSAKGYCYPPQKRLVQLNLNQTGHFVTGSRVNDQSADSQVQSQQQQIAHYLSNHSHWLSLSLFLGLGILLAFTPCVLPMVPILSSLVVGQSSRNTWRAFFLSLAYVLAMATTYAIAGVLTGKLGASIQAALQTPWVIGIFSALFIILALSLFDFYTLRLPQPIQSKLDQLNNRAHGGTYIGAASMGSMSALVASPCVTPPLIGALSYIGQTGDAIFGGMALFALGLGMGGPLLLIGTAAGRYIPKAGSWMNIIKALLGFILLGMAIWFLGRVFNDRIILLLWSLLILGAGGYMLYQYRHKLGTLFSCLLISYGLLLGYGLITQQSSPLFPWRYLAGYPSRTDEQQIHFVPIQSKQHMSSLLKEAKAQKKPILLDFYADWCVTCHQIERQIFQNKQMATILRRFLLARVDLTEHSKNTTKLKQAYNVVAPPAILFIGPDGQEVENLRLVGHVSTQKFKQAAHIILHQGVTSD